MISEQYFRNFEETGDGKGLMFNGCKFYRNYFHFANSAALRISSDAILRATVSFPNAQSPNHTVPEHAHNRGENGHINKVVTNLSKRCAGPEDQTYKHLITGWTRI